MNQCMTSDPVGDRGSMGLKGHLTVVLVRSFIRLLYGTLRIADFGIGWLDSVESKGECAIIPFFHGRQFPLVSYFAGRKTTVMSSMSRDGELQAQVLAGFGHRIVRGSTSRGGARGLIGMKKAMGEGYHATLAVDGPRGPLHEVKPGVIYLAKKTGASVIPVSASMNPAVVLEKAWDRYMLPVPFARAVILFGEPMHFDPDMDRDSMERDRTNLSDRMLSLQEEADRIAGRKKVESGKGKGN